MKTNLLKKGNLFLFLFFILAPVVQLNAQLKAITGIYVGDGSISRKITGLGFKPDFIIIKCDLYYAQIATSTLPANNTKDMNGGTPDPGLITSIDADGFTLSNNVKVNDLGTTYNFVAVQAEPGVFEVGSYVGNSTDNRNITGTTFRPDMVILISQDNNEKPLYSASTMNADQSMNFLNSVYVTDQVQAFNSNGFQVGKDKAVNVSGLRYHYIAMKHVPGKIYIGSYSGDGTNDRVVTGPGKGSFTMVKMGGQHALCRMWDMPVGKSHYFKNTASVVGRIERNTLNGFVVGGNNEINQAGNVYHFMQIYGINNILSVNISSFDIKKVEKNIELQWQTSEEKNNAFFVLERSRNGINFESIGQVAGKMNSNEMVSYKFIDANPLSGNSFYRLKTIDINGKIEYSEVKKIFIQQVVKEDFLFYPNPMQNNKLNIEYTGQDNTIFIDIMNSKGEKVDSKVLLNGNKSFDFKSNLPSGIYYLIGSNGKKELFRERVIK